MTVGVVVHLSGTNDSWMRFEHNSNLFFGNLLQFVFAGPRESQTFGNSISLLGGWRLSASVGCPDDDFPTSFSSCSFVLNIAALLHGSISYGRFGRITGIRYP
jgi:hypothetical protein